MFLRLPWIPGFGWTYCLSLPRSRSKTQYPMSQMSASIFLEFPRAERQRDLSSTGLRLPTESISLMLCRGEPWVTQSVTHFIAGTWRISWIIQSVYIKSASIKIPLWHLPAAPGPEFFWHPELFPSSVTSAAQLGSRTQFSVFQSVHKGRMRWGKKCISNNRRASKVGDT